MIELEFDLIGACLNEREASGEVVGLDPDFFESPYMGQIWRVLSASAGQFTPLTLAADLSGHPHFEEFGGIGFFGQLAERSYSPAIRQTADKIIADYQRRQGKLYLDWMHNALNGGADYGAVLGEYRSKLDALALVGGATERFKPVAISDLDIPLVRWIVKGMMPAAGMGFVAGASGAGKSFLTLHTALSMAAGRTMVMNRRCDHIGVVYVAAEDFEGCKSRVKAWELRHPSERTPAFELMNGPINLMDGACVEDLIAAINGSAKRFALQGVRLGLVVFDTLSRCIPGADENNAQFMSLAVNALQAIADRTATFVLPIAHYGKAGSAAGIRGWSGQNAASDMTLTVERDEDSGLRIVTFAKIKNGIDGHKLAFRLDRVGLGIYDDDGDELDSCVCMFEDMPSQTDMAEKVKAMPPGLKIVFAAVKYVTDNGSTYPPPMDRNAPVWSRAIDFADAKAQAIKTGLFGQSDTSRHNYFCKGLEMLVARKLICMDSAEDRIWII